MAEKKRYYEINGVIETPENVTLDDVINQFTEWLESKGYLFGGGYREEDENGDLL